MKNKIKNKIKKTMQPKMTIWSVVVAALPYLLPFTLLGFKLWMDRNFGGSADMEMIAVISMFGSDGFKSSPISYIISGLIMIWFLPFLFSFLIAIFEQWLVVQFKKKYPTKIKKIAIRYLATKSLLAFSIFAIVGVFLWNVFAVDKFVAMHIKATPDQPDYFQEFYIDPKTVAITAPTKKKNLIIIYAESLEDSFKDPAFYGRNLLATMGSVEEKGFVLNLRTAGTALETVPGHVNSQCGLPLKSTFFIDFKNDQGQSTMLQNAVCLSDILANHGYYNVFMAATTLHTGGMSYFYDHHNFHEAKYLEYWQANGYSDKSLATQGPWGIYDRDILNEGYKKLQSLQSEKQKTGQPFLLILATIDIHMPASSPCSMHKKKRQSFDEVIECSSAAMADFINNADKDGLLQDTDIFLIGDHRIISIREIKMKKWKAVYPNREPYGLFYSKDITLKRRDFTHYDILPTALESLGFVVDGHRLGFGYSAVADFSNYPSIAKWHRVMHQATLPSATYRSLWAKPSEDFKKYMLPATSKQKLSN